MTQRPRNSWIIDFGTDRDEKQAALYEEPFEYVRTHVKPLRDTNRRASTRNCWWRHGEARPGLRRALKGLGRSIVTPEVAKHHIFAWMDTDRVPDHTLHPEGADESDLEGRTLTDLYNARPTWLQNAHAALDRAVFAAYGWAEDPEQISEEELLGRLLGLNVRRAEEDAPASAQT